MPLTIRANISTTATGLDPGKVMVTANTGALTTSGVTTAQLTAVSNIQGLSGNVQTQINTVQAQVNTKQSNVTSTTDLVANSIALASAGNGNVVVVSSGKISTSNVTTNQLHYVSNLTAPVGSILDTQVYSNVGTFYWNKPAGAGLVFVIAVGGGGGGASGTAATGTAGVIGSGGGGGGSAVQRWLPAGIVADNVTVVVGEGGNGGTSVVRNGAAGNTIAVNGTDGSRSKFAGIAADGGGGGLGNMIFDNNSFLDANSSIQPGGYGCGGDQYQDRLLNTTPNWAQFSRTYPWTNLAGYLHRHPIWYTNETNPLAFGGRGGTANIAGNTLANSINPMDTEDQIPAGGGQSAGSPFLGTLASNVAGAAGANASINWTSGLLGGAAGSSTVAKDGAAGAGGIGNVCGAGGGAGYTVFFNSGIANVVAGNGGAGGFPGGGGGAGGCAKTGVVTAATGSAHSGAGGKGGNGVIIVYTYR